MGVAGNTMTESLSKKLIITRKDDFDQLFGSGKRLSGKFVYLIYLPLKEKNKTQLNIGFVCGKKIGGAVRRNDYKRLMREVFRKNKDVFTGFRILIVAQPAIANADLISLQDDILSLGKALPK